MNKRIAKKLSRKVYGYREWRKRCRILHESGLAEFREYRRSIGFSDDPKDYSYAIGCYNGTLVEGKMRYPNRFRDSTWMRVCACERRKGVGRWVNLEKYLVKE